MFKYLVLLGRAGTKIPHTRTRGGVPLWGQKNIQVDSTDDQLHEKIKNLVLKYSQYDCAALSDCLGVLESRLGVLKSRLGVLDSRMGVLGMKKPEDQEGEQQAMMNEGAEILLEILGIISRISALSVEQKTTSHHLIRVASGKCTELLRRFTLGSSRGYPWFVHSEANGAGDRVAGRS